MEASYRLSRQIQDLRDAYLNRDKQAIYNDIDVIASDLPDVLDACGKSDWADMVRKYLPMNCVHAVQDFAEEASIFEKNYMHLEWLARHYKQIEAAAGKVKKNCPFI